MVNCKSDIVQAFAVTANNSKTINLVFFGDSLTAGYGFTEEHSYPSLVKKKLLERGFDVNVVNAGISGDTSEGGLRRIGRILNKPVDIFMLELGINDGLRGLPLQKMKQNLQQIIDQVKSKNPDVQIIIAGMQIPVRIQNEYIRQFMSVFPDLARKNDAHLIPFFLENVIGIPSLNLPDGLHPNKEGYKIIAENVMKILQPIIEAKT